MIEFTLIAQPVLENVRALINELEDAVIQASFERSDELVDHLRSLLLGQPRACLDEADWQAIEQCMVDYMSNYLIPPSLTSTLRECLISAGIPSALPALLECAAAQNLWVLQLPLDGQDPLEEVQRP
jgi:hypothetical protein|uniref:hypothetical protein n=1 Tax=Pseudomonas laurentiana TaxID=2364649 RepID=UPI0029C84F00|nr:hypothetical protein [Pseudomonas laurentiana]